MGETEVRYLLADPGQTDITDREVAAEWLRQLEASRASALSERRDAREERMAASADSIRKDARSARIAAIAAAIIAAIATIFSAAMIKYL